MLLMVDNSVLCALGMCPFQGTCPCFYSDNDWLTVDCTSLNLGAIPNDLPPLTNTLLLRKNHISVLEADDLVHMLNLSYLDLSHNNITQIDEDAFQDLAGLETLLLNDNQLTIDDNSSSYNASVFAPLASLTTLDIQNNPFNSYYPTPRNYPTDIWQHLTSLVELRMDGHSGAFGDEFLLLRQMKSLVLGGRNCFIGEVSSTLFKGLENSPVQSLDLSNCSVATFQGEVFQYLPNLSWLSLVDNWAADMVLSMAAAQLSTSESQDRFGKYWNTSP